MNKDNNEMSQEFVETKSNKNYIIVVSILYLVVIILFVLLIFGINHQKEVVKNNHLNSKTNITTKTKDKEKVLKDSESIDEEFEINNEIIDVYNKL